MVVIQALIRVYILRQEFVEAGVVRKDLLGKGEPDMGIYYTDQIKEKLNSVQFHPMKHCTEYGV